MQRLKEHGCLFPAWAPLSGFTHGDCVKSPQGRVVVHVLVHQDSPGGHADFA